MNKMELWHGINMAPNNQTNAYLFDLCIELKIITKETKEGTIRYVLHPEFLEPLKVKPRYYKFVATWRWYFTCDNVLIETDKKQEAEH